MKRRSGFTLAEVLITLGIIGVVAAMTIPTLMTQTGKSEFKTGFKKTLSALNQAVTMSIALDYIDFADATSGTVEGSIYKILTDRMHVIKVETGMANEAATMFGTTGTNYTLFFADGMVISYPQANKECTSREVGHICKAVVDVNGTRNPNKIANCQYNAATGGSSSVTMDDKATVGSHGSVANICSEGNAYIADQYSVIFKGQQVIPNGYAARYVLYDN